MDRPLLLLYPNADLSALDGRLPLGPKGQWASCQQRSEECVYTLKERQEEGLQRPKAIYNGGSGLDAPRGREHGDLRSSWVPDCRRIEALRAAG